MLDLKKNISSVPHSAIIQNDRQQLTDIKAFLLNFYTQDALNASNMETSVPSRHIDKTDQKTEE